MTDKLKDKQTMTTGVSIARFAPNQALTLHNELVSVIVSDATETIVQYGNKAQRVFDTRDLAAYNDFGTFPPGTRFSRPVEGGMEELFIEQITPSHYIVEIINAQNVSGTSTFTYAELMAWHMTGPQSPPERTVPGTLYMPKVQPMSAESRAYLTKAANEEADQLAKDLESPDSEPDDQPLETELKQRIAQLEAQLATANQTIEKVAVQGQTTINTLEREINEVRAQNALHVAKLFAMGDEIEELRAKAAILNPAPTCKDILTLSQNIGPVEQRHKSDEELAGKLSDCWSVLNITVFANPNENTQRIVTLVRDLPATPAPKVTEKVTEAPLHIGAVPLTQRPPVQHPPTQTIVPPSAPVSIARTYNRFERGATKRIPTLASIQERRKQDAAEIDNILQRGREEQEALRRKFANQSSPFPVTGA